MFLRNITPFALAIQNLFRQLLNFGGLPRYIFCNLLDGRGDKIDMDQIFERFQARAEVPIRCAFTEIFCRC